MIIAVTGASGVGKTSVFRAIAQNLAGDKQIQVFHFDDMELPDWSKLEDSKKWQEEATFGWINKIVNVARSENVHVLFEGSTEIKFYLQGFEHNHYADYKILLFDCAQEVMKSRLIQRGQPELYHSDMIGWLNYLRNEATRHNIEIVRTDQLAIPEIAETIIKKVY